MCNACNGLFSFIGEIFGWILWLFYSIFKNYGLAIILFAIVTRLLLFPLTIKWLGRSFALRFARITFPPSS